MAVSRYLRLAGMRPWTIPADGNCMFRRHGQHLFIPGGLLTVLQAGFRRQWCPEGCYMVIRRGERQREPGSIWREGWMPLLQDPWATSTPPKIIIDSQPHLPITAPSQTRIVPSLLRILPGGRRPGANRATFVLLLLSSLPVLVQPPANRHALLDPPQSNPSLYPPPQCST